ncbi:sporulation integral membrane protein YlbJ [Caldanaerobacter sp.]|uniref:sporulation integral membrane protein YlbJ n=1 Tax=Caldanaerobacter sp. TaxID=2930036 RepID=UPI003C726E39
MKKTSYTILVSIIFLMVISLVIFPREALDAAKNGINLWLFTIAPSLFPFFIGSELLIQLGVVHLLGRLLEPLMRPLFNVPGSGSFAMAIGYTSGYPVGAQVITRLWEERLCSTEEAERLMSFCNNSGPLFMLGAVAIGMMNNLQAGYIIMASNYLAAITTGLLFRFYKKNNAKTMYSAKNSLYLTSFQNKKNFSLLLSEAVTKSVNTLLLIGGYVVFFSVAIEFLKIYSILDFLSLLLKPLLGYIGIPDEAIPSFLSGLLEITVGSNLISQLSIPVSQKVVLISSIIAWGGISIHGQVLGVISKTKISYFPYFIAKSLQFVFAGIYSYGMVKLMPLKEQALSVPAFNIYSPKNFTGLIELATLLFIALMVFLITLSLLLSLNTKS